MQMLIGVFLLAFALGPALNAPATVEGKWIVSVAAGKDKNASGRTRSRSAHDVTMTLTVKGEQVTGTWQTKFETTPWQVTGTWKAGRLDLMTTDRDIASTQDGKKVPIMAHWIIRGAFKGDTLGGTCTLVLPLDKDDPLWTSWTARPAS